MRDEEPFLQLDVHVGEDDFAGGYLLARRLVSPLHLPRVQVGLCLTGAALCASVIPTCMLYFGGLWGPLAGVGLFLFLAGLFGFVGPSLRRNRGRWMYGQNRTLSLPATVQLFDNRMEWRNESEWVLVYWTDIERCCEDKRYFVLEGDLEKPLLVIPRAPLAPGQQEELKRFLKHKLAVRYRGG